MTFIDVLRQARSSPRAVLHEFWTQYDPGKQRIHAFFEGHDDVVFYRKFLDQQLAAGVRLYTYRCEGKPRVYDSFIEITKRRPNIRGVLFFVDKDLDDILGVPWPTDPRIFVTDWYSVENYLVTRDVLYRFFQDSIRLANVEFEIAVLLNRFEEQLSRFHRLSISLMAWVVTMRRDGLKPNLNNISAGELFELSADCFVSGKPRHRIEYLMRTTGLMYRGALTRRLIETVRELQRIPPKRILRGKFEAWFFVEFWKILIKQLQTLASEGSGNLGVRIQLERSNFVEALVGHATLPRPLELFLGQHLQKSSSSQTESEPGLRLPRWALQIFHLLTRLFTKR